MWRKQSDIRNNIMNLPKQFDIANCWLKAYEGNESITIPSQLAT